METKDLQKCNKILKEELVRQQAIKKRRLKMNYLNEWIKLNYSRRYLEKHKPEIIKEIKKKNTKNRG